MYRKIVGLAKETVVYGFGSFANTAVAVLLLPVYGRFLTQEEYGAYSVLRVCIAVLTIVYELGMTTTLVRFYFDRDSEADHKRMFGSAWLCTQVIGLALTAVLVAAAGPISTALIGPTGKPIYVQLIALQGFFAAGVMLPHVLFRVRRQPGRFAVFGFANVALMVVATSYLVVWRHMGLIGALLGMLVAGVVFYVVSLPIVFANIRPTIWWSKLKEMLAFSLPLLPHALAMWILNFADRPLLRKLGSLEEVGVYSFGYTIGMAMSLIVGATGKSWPQFVFSSHAELEESKAKQLFSRTTTYYWIFLSSVALALSVFAPELLALGAGAKYAGAAPVVPIIAVAYLFMGLYTVLAVGVGIKKKSKFYFVATGTGAVANVAINLVLIPRFGMMGAAVATVLAYAIMCAVIHEISQRMYYVSYEKARMLRAFVLAVVAFFVTLLIHGGVPLTVALKLLTLAAYLAGLVVFRVIKRTEIAKVRDLVFRGAT